MDQDLATAVSNMENIEAKAPVTPAAAAPVTPAAPATPKSEAPAPGTPEFAAWAWENRGI